jgi:hypothetical protein
VHTAEKIANELAVDIENLQFDLSMLDSQVRENLIAEFSTSKVIHGYYFTRNPQVVKYLKAIKIGVAPMGSLGWVIEDTLGQGKESFRDYLEWGILVKEFNHDLMDYLEP